MSELRAYDPTWRDQLANLLIGDRSLIPSRRRFVEGLVGSTGLESGQVDDRSSLNGAMVSGVM
jgi:hypothetical protein